MYKITKINDFETAKERYHRERIESVQQEYLRYAAEILCRKVTPNRIINHIAAHFCMSGYGVKSILMRAGIYKSAKEPVVRLQSSTNTIPCNF